MLVIFSIIIIFLIVYLVIDLQKIRRLIDHVEERVEKSTQERLRIQEQLETNTASIASLLDVSSRRSQGAIDKMHQLTDSFKRARRAKHD